MIKRIAYLYNVLVILGCQSIFYIIVVFCGFIMQISSVFTFRYNLPFYLDFFESLPERDRSK